MLNRKAVIFLGALFLAGGFFITCFAGTGAEQKGSSAQEQSFQSSRDVNFPFVTGNRFKTGELFYKMTFAVLVVIALAIGVAYFLKKLLPKIARLPAKQIRIVETVSLGQHRNIYLIEAAGRKILIGSTGETITRLADLSEPVEMK